MWKFYEVETYDIREDKTIKIESFDEIKEAKEYIVRTIKNNLIDYCQKLILMKRVYNMDRELLEEETIIEYNTNFDDELEKFILEEVVK